MEFFHLWKYKQSSFYMVIQDCKHIHKGKMVQSDLNNKWENWNCSVVFKNIVKTKKNIVKTLKTLTVVVSV